MELRQEGGGTGPVVTGLRGRAFLVGDAVFESGLILTPDSAAAFDGPLSLSAVEPALLIDPPPEILLLGTGPALVQPDTLFRETLAARDIGLEAMDSRAAARAWSLLRQEGRWIAAVLLAL